jgi:hypothetical protein
MNKMLKYCLFLFAATLFCSCSIDSEQPFENPLNKSEIAMLRSAVNQINSEDITVYYKKIRILSKETSPYSEVNGVSRQTARPFPERSSHIAQCFYDVHQAIRSTPLWYINYWIPNYPIWTGNRFIGFGVTINRIAVVQIIDKLISFVKTKRRIYQLCIRRKYR